MTDDRKSGIALIAGSVGGILTMAMHPTAAGSVSTEQVMRLMAMSGAVHALAMISMLALFLGACGLTKRIADGDRTAFAGIVTFGFACVAIMMATAVSGFIVPEIMRRMVSDVASAREQWLAVIYGIFQINQAFARIYSVGASLAIILWSVSVLHNGGLGRGSAIYGCVIAVIIILAVGSGHVRLDVHGMAAVGLGQVVWFILVGVEMCGREDRAIE